MASPLAPAPMPSPGSYGTWGSVKYLGNISAIGGITCILLFLLVKLQDDHQLPHPVHLITKLVAVWKTTDGLIARLCGADASDYLSLLRATFSLLGLLSLPGLLILVPIDVYAGDVPLSDNLVAATVSHLPTGSPWFWVHVAFTALTCALVHFQLERLEAQLQTSRFRDFGSTGQGAGSIAAFTLMIKGVPRGLAKDKQPLLEYFEHLYPGKIYHVAVPPDLVTYLHTHTELKSCRERLETTARKMAEAEQREEEREAGELPEEARLDYVEDGWYTEGVEREAQLAPEWEAYEPLRSSSGRSASGGASGMTDDADELLGGQRGKPRLLWKWSLWRGLDTWWQDVVLRRRGRKGRVKVKVKWLWFCCGVGRRQRGSGSWRRAFWSVGCWEWRDEVAWLEHRIVGLEIRQRRYQEGQARGAGIAFVVFKDVFTATRALRDAAWASPHRQEPPLGTASWRAERAPPPNKVQWRHVGNSALSRRLRSLLVNCGVFSMLLFWSSPLAIITALNEATQKLDPDASWVWHHWAYDWLAAFSLQFLPNALVFFAMYSYIPLALTRLAKFECHVTISGEQQATLIKMVGFYLLNLFLLKAMVETTLQSAILHFSQCYAQPRGECPGADRWFSKTFIGNSALSAIAFLLTSSFLGVSLDLLSPGWLIKRRLHSLWTRASLALPSLPPLFLSRRHAAIADPGSEETPPGVLAVELEDEAAASRVGDAGERQARSSQQHVSSTLSPAPGSSAGRPQRGEVRSVFSVQDESRRGRNKREVSREDMESDEEEEEEEEGRLYYAEEPSSGFASNPAPGPHVSSDRPNDSTVPLLSQGASLRGPSFDFPQYHAYNLTAFAMTLLYSSAAPLVLPAGAAFFFYRFLVDKYNFLYKYRRVSASPSATDGKLMSTVLKVMRVILCAYLAAMAAYLALRGDDLNLQMLVTVVLLLAVGLKYFLDRFLGLPHEGGGLDAYFAGGTLGSVEQVLEDGVVGYEVSSQRAMRDAVL